MKELYSDFTKDDLWLIEEQQWIKEQQNIRETQFTLGNGYMGIRGVLEEIPYDAMAGTYISGIYDKMGSQVAELVNLPNPINFKFTIAGEKLGLVATDILQHRRVLNMKKALLVRYTLYKDTKKRRYHYQSLRFVSLHNRNIGAIQIAITPVDANCLMDVNTGIDISISNAGILSEGRKKHFRIRELGQSNQAGFLAIETLEKKHIVVYRSGFYYQINRKKIFAKDNIFRLKLKKGQTVIFTKIFFVKAFPYKENHISYIRQTSQIFNKAFRGKFSVLLGNHLKMWQRLWKKADILIEGTKNLQENLRFNIYHMLICAHYDNGATSIGARTLSGEGYRGHIFWDAEIFLFPFYLFNFPRVAKNMLLYRYKRLDKARQLAQKDGYKGARFAWESADTGEEETPAWSRDFDKTLIKIATHKQEQHLTADIAYAIYSYYTATGDEKFMQTSGYELFCETARFWASRVKYNKRSNSYELNHVIGPDEFHRDVNNNAYTNMMAKWNLLAAYKLFCSLKNNPDLYKRLQERLKIGKKELNDWRKVASGIRINMNKKKVIEQFDGYFKLQKVALTRTDENGIPLIPSRIKAKNLNKTDLVKQADVIMLLYLLNEAFSLKTKIANYDFYIRRTVHKSSLSPSVHAIVGCEVGDLNRAYNLFKVSLRTDIADVYENSHEGMHAASLGGTWQAVIFGFAGIKIRRGKLMINPHLPRAWKKISFSLIWQGALIKFELTNETIKLKVHSRQRKNIELGIFSKMMPMQANKVHIFRRRTIEVKAETFY